MDIIDLRSDTVTLPSAGMRQAMAVAEVGDDVWGEDPTVIRLQDEVARLLGKEAALFVPSGTMANQIAIKAHTRPGDEMLVGWGSHCIRFEAGAAAAISGVHHRVLGENGLFSVEDVAGAMQPSDIHYPPTRLVWIENTHNRGGGRIFPQDRVEAVAAFAHERGIAVHIDGARLLNAAVATGRPAAELARPADSTSICLSKGLGAPVGSVLAGTAGFIREGRRYRKMLGGAMRQVGILAAAGLYALDRNVARLAEDHANARLIAERIARLPLVCLDPSVVQTNIVIFEIERAGLDAEAFIGRCAELGLLLSLAGPFGLRAVTHLDVDRRACERAVQIIGDVLESSF